MSRSASAAMLADIVKAVGDKSGKMGPDWVPVLEAVPLFAGLSKRHLRRMASLAEPARFEANTTVVRAGARGDAFYVILDGTASVTAPKESVRLGPMDFFGEMSLLDGGPRAATVTADEDMLTMRLAREPFMKLIDSEPAIARGLMKELVTRVRRLEGSPNA